MLMISRIYVKRKQDLAPRPDIRLDLDSADEFRATAGDQTSLQGFEGGARGAIRHRLICPTSASLQLDARHIIGKALR